jgi:hypothetical protein
MSNEATELDDLISEKEAAQILKQKPGTLTSWRSLGRGPAYMKAGRTILYSRSAVLQYVVASLRRPQPAKERRIARSISVTAA